MCSVVVIGTRSLVFYLHFNSTLSNKFLLSFFCARISTNYNRVCLQFDAYTSLHGLYRMLTEPPVKMMVVGASKSECSQGTSQLAELWNLVQVSYLVILQVSICQSVSLCVCNSVCLYLAYLANLHTIAFAFGRYVARVPIMCTVLHV